MKSWNVAANLQGDSRLAKAIEGARDSLEDVLGVESSALVDAEWTLDSRSGKQMLVLRLADWTWPEGVRIEFDPADLSSEYVMRRKFHKIWGDLLQARNHQQLRELKQLSTAE